MDNSAIINPVSGKKSPKLGSVAVMAATLPDLSLLCRAFGREQEDYIDFAVSRLYTGNTDGDRVALAGPFTGAPHAVILLENLIVCGVEKIVFVGWCGAVSPKVNTGDIIVATGAYSDEGTSKHYGMCCGNEVLPTSYPLTEIIQNTLNHTKIPYHSGPIWSTDAVFRETVEKVEFYQGKHVLGVEMELSALISVCRFRGVEVASVQVVSDEISSFKWQPGFGDKRFKKSRKKVSELIPDVCKRIVDGIRG